jgi:N-acetylmuramoyl-L-alanine amidase
MARDIRLVVIHCSATPNDRDLFGPAPKMTPFPVEVINEWHRARGFKRDPEAAKRMNPALDAIGYHYVIYRSGVVVTGRAEDEVGAHVKGFNQKSIGVCLLGTDQYEPRQWASLKKLVGLIRGRYPGVKLLGHRDLSPDKDGDGQVEPHEWLKTCPGFDVAAWEAAGFVPPQEAIYNPQKEAA